MTDEIPLEKPKENVPESSETSNRDTAKEAAQEPRPPDPGRAPSEPPKPSSAIAESTVLQPSRPRRSVMRQFFRSVLWTFLGLFLVFILAVVGYLEIKSRMLPVSGQKKQIVVTIPAGASAIQIGHILKEKGVIRDDDVFRFLVSFKDVGAQLKAGEHVLDASMPMTVVLDSLLHGNYKLYHLTIPEGLTMKQVAAKVGESGLADATEFLALCRDKAFIRSLGLDTDTLEGYLFPETYSFIKNTSARKIATAMVDRFWAVWAKYKDEAEKNPLSRKEIVTLASIIEKETGADFERPMIAKVFLNRLQKGMKLETDPTVIYGVEDFDGNLTRKHLQTPTPYNTYVIKGLPPGPIANPGEASIKAVLEPADVGYIFFVSKNDGTHQFSNTLREHNRAVNKFQRQGGSGSN